MLADVSSPTRLCDLLTIARDDHGQLAVRLMAMRGLAAFAPEEDLDNDSLLIAHSRGALDDLDYVGDDLVLERLHIGAVPAEQEQL
jgi:hypothetical protein